MKRYDTNSRTSEVSEWTSSNARIENGEQFKTERSLRSTVLGLAETNTEWDCEEGCPRSIIQQQIQGAYNHAVCAYSTSRIKHDAYWKPGGTITAVYNPWNGHVIDKGADNRLGNWSYATLRGKK
jgi:hypothetical protein